MECNHVDGFSHCSECCDEEHAEMHKQDYALRLLNQHYREALTWILKEPFGCAFCDSGKLRKLGLEHEGRCGFAKAQDLIGDGVKPESGKGGSV